MLFTSSGLPLLGKLFRLALCSIHGTTVSQPALTRPKFSWLYYYLHLETIRWPKKFIQSDFPLVLSGVIDGMATKRQKKLEGAKWEWIALKTMYELARTHKSITADTFWFEMEKQGAPKEHIGKNSARSFRMAQKTKLIRRGESYIVSARKGNRSAVLPVWLCLRYGEKAN